MSPVVWSEVRASMITGALLAIALVYLLDWSHPVMGGLALMAALLWTIGTHTYMSSAVTSERATTAQIAAAAQSEVRAGPRRPL